MNSKECIEKCMLENILLALFYLQIVIKYSNYVKNYSAK